MSMYLKLEQFQLNKDDSHNYYELIDAFNLNDVWVHGDGFPKFDLDFVKFHPKFFVLSDKSPKFIETYDLRFKFNYDFHKEKREIVVHSIADLSFRFECYLFEKQINKEYVNDKKELFGKLNELITFLQITRNNT